MNYDRSCIDKRRDSLALRYHLTRWRLQLAIQDGWLTLPKRRKGEKPWNLGTLPIEWVPTGMPWWDPAKEITGDLKAIGAGLDNPQRICKERGRGDFYENVDQIPALLWQGNHADNRVENIAGDVGVGFYAEDSAQLALLIQRGGNTVLGRDVDVAKVKRTGGTFASLGATINGEVVL